MDKRTRLIALQIGLFLATLFTTTMAGVLFLGTPEKMKDATFWSSLHVGLPFSLPFMFALLTHEFGHYFTAMYHRVKASLPYFIPFPAITGTLGAIIIQDKAPSNKQSFDIGIAGPLAGFVVAICCLFYGMTHLPPADYVFSVHPEFKKFGANYADSVYQKPFLKEDQEVFRFGKSLMYVMFEQLADDPSRLPNMYEMMHYPFLVAGYLALFFTALNLMPIGQLDGGHILYGLLGYERHKKVATIAFLCFLFYAGLGCDYVNPYIPTEELIIAMPLYVGFLFIILTTFKLPKRDTLMYAVIIFGVQVMLAKFFPQVKGYSGWLLFAVILARMVGIEHPRSSVEEPLGMGRKILGWVALLIFVLCFTPMPLNFS